MVQDHDDDIIELTEVFTGESSPKDQEVIELTQEAVELKEPLSDDVSLTRNDDEHIRPSLDWKEIEAALEKIIEKKFSGGIEKIFFEVLEKVIKQELEDIKSKLKKDLDDMSHRSD